MGGIHLPGHATLIDIPLKYEPLHDPLQQALTEFGYENLD